MHGFFIFFKKLYLKDSKKKSLEHWQILRLSSLMPKIVSGFFFAYEK